MKWIGISGSKLTDAHMEADVRQDVNEILMQGNGIVVGGAIGVDQIAAEEALKQDPGAEYIKVCLPAALSLYIDHYRTRAEEEVITHEQADALTHLLSLVKKRNPKALIEHPTNTVMNRETYYERNSKIVELSDALHAFQANHSKGTQDTVDKAKARGIPVTLRTYDLP